MSGLIEKRGMDTQEELMPPLVLTGRNVGENNLLAHPAACQNVLNGSQWSMEGQEIGEMAYFFVKNDPVDPTGDKIREIMSNFVVLPHDHTTRREGKRTQV